MQEIWEIINKIGEAINEIWQYAQTTIKWVGMAIDYIETAITYAYQFINSFPLWLKAFAMACIVITTCYTILGRAGGNSE